MRSDSTSFLMWCDSSDCLMSNKAISSHWQTGSSLRRTTSRIWTRIGSDSALATAAMRSVSNSRARPTGGAQQASAEGPAGTMGSSVVTSMSFDVRTVPGVAPLMGRAVALAPLSARPDLARGGPRADAVALVLIGRERLPGAVLALVLARRQHGSVDNDEIAGQRHRPTLGASARRSAARPASQII